VKIPRTILQVFFAVVQGVMVAMVNYLVGRCVHNLSVYFNYSGSATAGDSPSHINDVVAPGDAPRKNYERIVILGVNDCRVTFVQRNRSGGPVGFFRLSFYLH